MHRRQKRRAHWAAYLWPGLPHLWISGSWAGLALAIGFTGLLNVLILSTLVWPEWLTPRVKLGCALSAGGVWLVALWETRRELRRLAALRTAREASADGDAPSPAAPHSPAARRADALLRLAQCEYLRGEWAEAERSLRELLKLDRDDVEAHLLLAGVHRLAGRAADARRRLRRLATRDDAQRWRLEIQRELARIEQPQNASDDAPPSAA